MIIQLNAHNAEPYIEQLSELLQDVVDGGASVGFLAPLSLTEATEYWQTVMASLGEGLALWVALQQGRVVGAVQLSLCLKNNGLHRAEVQKLFVLRTQRGRGIAQKLMTQLEAFALRHERTLLVLDTEAGSAAESLYQRLGWLRVGEIPNYAKSPAGALRATALYYKLLQ